MQAARNFRLTFEKRPHQPAKLSQTTFQRAHALEPIKAKRGSYGRSFKWSSAVKALAILGLRSAAQHYRTHSEDPYRMRGFRPSPAASLNDAITKHQHWLTDLFCEHPDADYAVDQILSRKNADFNTDRDAPVEVWFNPEQVPSAGIEIVLNNEIVDDVEQLDQLATELEIRWDGGSPVVDPRSEFVGLCHQIGEIGMTEFFHRSIRFLSHEAGLEIIGPLGYPFVRRLQGREAVIRAMAQEFDSIEDCMAEVNAVYVHDETVVSVLEVRGRVGEHPIHRSGLQKYRFHDGKIVAVYELIDVRIGELVPQVQLG